MVLNSLADSATTLVASLDPRRENGSLVPATKYGRNMAACWVGTRRGDFATGHESGDIMVRVGLVALCA